MRRAQRLAPWGKLLGLAPLGRGQGGGVAGPDQFGDAPYYLVSDTFTTARSAGAVNGTDAEPGPARRQVTDTGNTESITGSRLTVVNSAGTRDPNHIYACGYALGRVMVAEVTPGGTGNNARVGFGWTTSSNLLDAGLRFATGGALAPSRSPGTGPNVATFSSATSYRVAVVMLLDGALFFIKGGAYTNWTLLWIERNYVVALDTFRVGIQAIAAAQSYTSDYIRVPAEKWLPTPLVSDGFSTWGTSDGLGHAEGVAGGLGAGGGGLAMTAFYGTWGAAGGVAQCSALNSGIGLAGRDVGTADMIVTAKVTRSAGVAGLFVRENADDRVMAVHNGTNAQLIKRVAGVDTTLVNTAATYVAGAELQLICQGTAFRLFYNNVAIGSETTISDVSLQAETLAGLYTTDTSNTFDDLVVFARGTAAEYAALDTVGNPLANLAWAGATWALDGAGRAYNTPTLGSELLTNGGFDSDLSGWSSEGGVGSQSWVSGTLRNVHTSGSTYSTVQSKPTTAGQWLRASVNVLARTASFSNLKLRRHTGSAIIAQSINAPSAPLALAVTARALDTPTYTLLSNGAGTTDWDNASLKVITLSATLATVAGSSATQTAAAKIHTLTTGTQAGVVSLLDSTSSPANFLIGYHDGTNAKLDKCVAGTYTSLISTAVAFSSNAQIEIRRPSGNTFQLWYNGTQRGTDQTVSDAGIISNTRYGLFSTYEGNLFSEFSLDDYLVPFDLPGA